MAEDPKRRLAWPSYGRGGAERSGQEVKVLVEVADATGPAELPSEPIACGIAYLDHMLDQLNSHGQLRVSVQAWRAGQLLRLHSNDAFVQGCDSEVAELVGSALGAALRQMLDERRPSGSFRFLVPLDEALTDLSLDFSEASVEIALAPFGAFPPAGRQRIGSFRTALTEVILRRVAEELKVGLKVKKLRGDNAHHIVEATFKSFARCLRRAMDAASGLVNGGPRFSAAVLGERRVQKKRGTKETNIDISVDLDLSPETPERVATGFQTLDALLRRLGSGLQLTASCVGDAWIDEHHSVEDVMITVGQALHQALGSKAGCCRMAFAEAAYQSAQVLCVMDLSNRPMFCSDLQWQGQQEEMAEDVSVEMLHHAFESFVVNAAMTVHLVQVRPEGGVSPCALDLALAAAEAMGAALKQCVSIDVRRAGVTASSKGTLST